MILASVLYYKASTFFLVSESYELVRENARCVDGGMIISEVYSLEKCAYECGNTHGATMFRHGKTGTDYCQEQDKCRCSCVMDESTCEDNIVVHENMDLYRINTPSGNYISPLHHSFKHCCFLHLIFSNKKL